MNNEIKKAIEMAFREGFLKGFMTSGEGCNGEYPYIDQGIDPVTDPNFVDDREHALQSYFEELAKQAGI